MAVDWFQAIRQRNIAGRTIMRVRASLLARRRGAEFANVETFAMYIGYARSGHTLLASLVQAHPDTCVANELDVLGLIEAGFTRPQIFAMTLANAEAFGQRGAEWTGYSYRVEGQWQGRFRNLRVIGDKKGGVSTTRLRNNPHLLDELRKTVGVPIRALHMTRNPFDHAASRARHKPDWAPDKVLDRLFWLYDAVEAIREQTSDDEMLHVRHEDLIDDPRATLTAIASFVGLDAPDDWLDACAAIVRPAPKRETIEWTDELVARVNERVAKHEFLRSYARDAR